MTMNDKMFLFTYYLSRAFHNDKIEADRFENLMYFKLNISNIYLIFFYKYIKSFSFSQMPFQLTLC